MKKTIFTTTDLPSGKSAVLYEGTGYHFFKASQAAYGSTPLFVRYLLLDLLEVDGAALTEQTLDELHITDVVYAAEALSLMMSTDKRHRFF